jgi:hypothetical protein
MNRAMNRGRTAGYALVALLALVLALIAWNWPALKAQAEAGSAYGARIGCSCRYVQGRGMESCREDMEPGMEMVRLDDDPAARAVTGSVPLMARRTARLKPGFGCVLDPVRR